MVALTESLSAESLIASLISVSVAAAFTSISNLLVPELIANLPSPTAVPLGTAAATNLWLSARLLTLIEKLFISYRETFSDAKKVLDRYSIGLAHHKVIHLISMYQGISISELLKRLKVTKQSLNRVLKDLIKLDILTFKKDKVK